MFHSKKWVLLDGPRIEIRVFDKANVRLRGQESRTKEDQEGAASGAPTFHAYRLVSTQVDNRTSKDLDFNPEACQSGSI